MEGDLKDPILENKGVSSTGYETNFSVISNRSLDLIAAYIELIWKVRSMKEIPGSKILRNTKTYFIDRTLRSRDTLWMQHCASSLRELVGDGMQIPNDFHKALKFLPLETDKGIPNQYYINIRSFRDFFHALVHFDEDSALDQARKITGDNKLQEVDEIIFEKICYSFIQTLHNLFSENCMKNVKSI